MPRKNPPIASPLPAFVLGLALAFTLVAAPPPARGQQLEMLDRIAIIADDDIILESEIWQELRALKGRLRERGTTLPPEPELLRQVLQYLVIQSLQLQMAKEAGIFVDEQKVQQALQITAANAGQTVDQFLRGVERQGGSPSQVRDELTRQLRINEIQTARVRPRVRLTEREVDTFLNSEEGQSLFADEFLVQHILLPTRDGAGEARRLARELIKRAEGGEDFSDLAVRYSAARTALEGGELGWRKLGELPRRFSPLVRRMQRGDVSEPIEDERAIHIIRLADRRGDTTEYVRQYKVRHILLKPNAIRDSGASKLEIEELREQIEEGETFENMARLHSEDPNSALLGGELEPLPLADFPPRFAEVVEGLELNTLSQPFETEAGWHIAEVLESRLEDTTESKMRQRAQQVLFQRKYEEELDLFLDNLMDNSYLEYKEPWAEYDPG